jgi:hypothetical protein
VSLWRFARLQFSRCVLIISRGVLLVPNLHFRMTSTGVFECGIYTGITGGAWAFDTAPMGKILYLNKLAMRCVLATSATEHSTAATAKSHDRELPFVVEECEVSRRFTAEKKSEFDAATKSTVIMKI